MFSQQKDLLTVKVVFSVIISVLGILGNLVVIFVIQVLKEYKKSVTHWYVLQLAIADTVFLLTLPFKISEDLHEGWIYPEWMCKAKETLLFVNYNASILFLMIMSIDRYIAVCHSFSKVVKKLRRHRIAVIITVITWLVAISFSLPVIIYSTITGNHPNCVCSYELPAPPLNHTANCLKEGFTDPELLKSCLQISDTHNPYNGLQYCRDHIIAEDSDNYISLYDDDSGSGNYSDDYLHGNYTGNNNVYYDVDNQNYNGSWSVENNTVKTKIDFVSGFDTNADLLRIYCTYSNPPPGWIAFIVFNFIVLFVIPFLMMLVCYGLIVKKLSASQLRMSLARRNEPISQKTESDKPGRRRSSRSDSDRRRVTMMCAALVFCFGICWLPFHITNFAKLNGINVPPGSENLCQILPVIGALMAYLNSAINPYCYGFMGTNFFRRLGSATRSVRYSVRRRGSSSVSISGFGQQQRQRRGLNRRRNTSTTASGPDVAKSFRNFRGRYRAGSESKRTRAESTCATPSGNGQLTADSLPRRTFKFPIYTL
ncbi:uncharacterized protein LOC143462164 isoform X2 [Clavelina lepadiformis]|uniref:uncharacterized protein LOC143462164 isoform X2 n=1 Tax=Clavelina lepadiformis TaxID=159417 RepID=UPI004040F3FE